MAWLNPTYGVYRVISPTWKGCMVVVISPQKRQGIGILISNESKDLKQHKWLLLHEVISLCIRNIWGSIWCRTLRTGNTGNNWAAFQRQNIYNDSWIEQASSKAFKLLKQATITSHQCCKQFENFHHVHPFFSSPDSMLLQVEMKNINFWKVVLTTKTWCLRIVHVDPNKTLVASWNTCLSYQHVFLRRILCITIFLNRMLSLKTTNNQTTNSQDSQQPTRHNMLEPCTGSTPKKRIIAIARRRIFFGFLGVRRVALLWVAQSKKIDPKKCRPRRFGGYTPPETNIAP